MFDIYGSEKKIRIKAAKVLLYNPNNYLLTFSARAEYETFSCNKLNKKTRKERGEEKLKQDKNKKNK